jgi:hypothetical protein
MRSMDQLPITGSTSERHQNWISVASRGAVEMGRQEAIGAKYQMWSTGCSKPCVLAQIG